MDNQQLVFASLEPSFAPKKHVSGLKGPIASFAIEKLREGWTAKEALELVKEAFPVAKTSIKCIYWYASKAGIKLSASTYQEAVGE